MYVSATIKQLGILLWLTIGTYTTAQHYCGDHTLRTWENANASCKLYTPLFSTIRTGTFLSTKVASRHSKIWTGYVKTYHDFEYIGCSSARNIIFKKYSIASHPSPGLCFSECRESRFFGIGERVRNHWICYCLEKTPERYLYKETFCISPCYADAGINCGGCHGSGTCSEYVSLYREVGLSTSVNGSCRSYNPVNKRYMWESCLQYRHSLCISYWTHLVWVSTNPIYRWKAAVWNCFNRNGYPLYNYAELSWTPRQSVWTSVFRSLVIGPASDVPNPVSTRILYGYLQYSRSHNWFYFNFTEYPSAVGASLCDADTLAAGSCSSIKTSTTRTSSTTPIPSTTTTATPTNPTNGTPSTKSTTRSTTTTPRTRPTTTPIVVPANTEATITSTFTIANTASEQTGTSKSPNTLDTDADRLTSGNNNTHVGLYVGVSIGGLVVLLTGGGFVILMRRRRKDPAAKSAVGNTAINDTYSDPVTSANPSRSEIHNTTAASPIYLNIKGAKYERNPKPPADELSADTEDYTYIRAEHMNPTGDDEGQYAQNVYHVLEKEDHAGHGSRNVAFSPDSDEYNVCGMYPNKGGASDNVYNTTNFGANVTDVDYDVSGHVPAKGNGLHDVYSHISHERLNVDDTYDHTSGNIGDQNGHGKPNDDVYNTATTANSGETYSTYDQAEQSQNKQLCVDPLYSKATYKC